MIAIIAVGTQLILLPFESCIVDPSSTSVIFGNVER
jgi:hypothetical protein